jgi:hypothetical protein
MGNASSTLRSAATLSSAGTELLSAACLSTTGPSNYSASDRLHYNILNDMHTKHNTIQRILTLSLILAAISTLMSGCGSDDHHRGAWWGGNDHSDDKQVTVGDRGNGGDTDMSVSVRAPDHDDRN